VCRGRRGGKGEGKYALYDFRRNDLARSAPGGEGIEDDDLVVFDGGLEFGLAVEDNFSISFSKNSNASSCCALIIARGMN
jgi:hypothetical protein